MTRNRHSMLQLVAIALALVSTAECSEGQRHQRLNLHHTNNRQFLAANAEQTPDANGDLPAPVALTVEEGGASAKATDQEETQDDSTEDSTEDESTEDDSTEGEGPVSNAAPPAATSVASTVEASGTEAAATEQSTEEEDADEDSDYDDTNSSSIPRHDNLLENVRDAHTRLAENLRTQVDAHLELKDLDDERKSAEEIDANVKVVANETQAPLTAKFLGDMWKEMRTFSKPFYKEHLQVKLADLRKEQPELEANANIAQAALGSWPARYAADAPVSAPADAAGDAPAA